jgi:hypothetical protein
MLLLNKNKIPICPVGGHGITGSGTVSHTSNFTLSCATERDFQTRYLFLYDEKGIS